MKKYFILFMLMCCVLTINAQYRRDSYAGWNKSVGLSVGYSMIHSNIEKLSMFDYEPSKNMFEINLNLYGIYCGLDLGSSDHRGDYYDYDRIHTWGMKFGPSMMFDDYKHTRIIITPYAGFLKTDLSVPRYYSDYYYDYYAGDRTLRSKDVFIYGGKLDICIDNFQIGVHGSNMEFGVDVGFNIPMND